MSSEVRNTPNTTPTRMQSEVTEEESVSDCNENKEQMPSIIPIKCGPLTAKMHVERFLCPGIHQQCIELEGESELITPKAFTIRANKDKQKDWKGSIRIGKSNLRTLMEMRSFDFHNHANFCSAKCQSRNYITPKERDPSEKDGSRRGSYSKSMSNMSMLNMKMENSPTLKSLFKNPQFAQMVNQALRNNNTNNNSIFASNDHSGFTNVAPIPTSSTASASQANEEIIDVDTVDSNETLTSSLSKITTTTTPHDVELLTTQMNNDPSLFWSEMVKCGLSDQIIDQMIESLNNMREKLKNGNVINVAPFLSRTIASLGACDKVISMVRRRNSLSSNAQHRLSTDYSSMEDTMSRKRSIDDGPQSIVEALNAKRPCYQFPTPPTYPNASASESLEAIAALIQLQQIKTQSPTEMLMQLAASINPNVSVSSPSPMQHLNDSLLAIK